MARLLRMIAAMLIAGVLRRRSAEAVDAEIAAMPYRRQIWIVAAVLLLLFIVAMVFGAFGWVGVLIFWMLVILLVR